MNLPFVLWSPAAGLVSISEEDHDKIIVELKSSSGLVLVGWNLGLCGFNLSKRRCAPRFASFRIGHHGSPRGLDSRFVTSPRWCGVQRLQPLHTIKMATNETSSILPLIKTLITGSHILHHHGILDAYGHLSVRHPEKTDTFLMPRNTAPALLSSQVDIVEYRVEDASPVEPNSPPGYVERYIHSEIYKHHPEIQSVIHSHSPAILPFTITAVDLRPCVHMAGFLGDRVPKFDIAEFYSNDDVRDLLIRNQRLGEQLSVCFSRGEEKCYNPVVLMRGHGFTVAGGSIEESVFRAIYTAENARVQSASLTLQSAAGTTPLKHGKSLYFLDDSELFDANKMTQWSVVRPWNLWVKEVEVNELYANNL